ncbi:MAG: phage adaptor protein [Pseudomonadota bacterium]
MADVMTYASLQTDIRDYLERGNEQDETVLRQIPRIIANTQRTLADQLKIQGYLGSFTSAMQEGVNVIAKPDGWRSTVSINYGRGANGADRFTLRARGYEYIRALYPNDDELGAPEFYADYDLNHWLVGPTPADDYPFEAMVYRLPDLLSESNQQNYLTQYAPFLLLYSCLVGMEAFLKEDTRIPVWKSLAKEQFDSINVEDIRRMVDRAQLRSTD